MKTEKLILLCIVMLFFQLVACERNKIEDEAPAPIGARTGTDSVGTPVTGRIITEKTTGIKQKEPINFTLVDPKSPYVMWRVVPAQIVNNNGAQSVIYFQKAGNYRVFAIDSISYDTAYLDVQVGDEIYTPQTGEQAFRDDEVIKITPSFYADSANVLVLGLSTSGNYNCKNNNLGASIKDTGNLFEIQLHGVATNTFCQPGENIPKAKLYLVSPAVENYAGKIEISFNNKTYKGSFKKTGNKYEFDWPYESGVVFTTKSI